MKQMVIPDLTVPILDFFLNTLLVHTFFFLQIFFFNDTYHSCTVYDSKSNIFQQVLAIFINFTCLSLPPNSTNQIRRCRSWPFTHFRFPQAGTFVWLKLGCSIKTWILVYYAIIYAYFTRYIETTKCSLKGKVKEQQTQVGYMYIQLL